MKFLQKLAPLLVEHEVPLESSLCSILYKKIISAYFRDIVGSLPTRGNYQVVWPKRTALVRESWRQIPEELLIIILGRDYAIITKPSDIIIKGSYIPGGKGVWNGYGNDTEVSRTMARRAMKGIRSRRASRGVERYIVT